MDDQPKTEAHSPETLSFYQRYNLAMINWAKTHKNTNFPIMEVDGKLVWVNRKTRRKMTRGNRVEVYRHNYK